MININEVLKQIQDKQYRALKQTLLSENYADIAALFDELPPEKYVLVFRMLSKDIAADVFSELFHETQQAIVMGLSDEEIGDIIEELYVDDAVDFLEEMPAGLVRKVLANAEEDTRRHINHILKYPENSAGSIMTVEYVNLVGNLTVDNAFERIRRTGTDKETIYTCYVTDATRHLKGIVSVRRLLLADLSDPVEDVMTRQFIAANTLDDREDVARIFEKYNLMALPVVDSENRLVGIITFDDIIDVLQEEATEDFQKMAAMLPSEKPYLKTSVIELARNRVVWLVVLMFSAMITGGILENFEAAIAVMPLLVTFIPMLTDTGGNAGSQSATMVIRGMALDEVGLKDFFKVWRKELFTGLTVGTLLSVLNFARVCIQYPGKELVAATVSISVLLTVVLAQTLGGLLPLIAKVCKADPAVMAAPIITTIVDAFSLVIFFMIAKSLLAL